MKESNSNYCRLEQFTEIRFIGIVFFPLFFERKKKLRNISEVDIDHFYDIRLDWLISHDNL